MRPGDAEALHALQKAAGDVLPGPVWKAIEAEVEEVGMLGLTGSSRVIIDNLVAKHGDPTRPGYAAMHPRGGAAGAASLRAHAAAKLEAGRKNLKPGDAVVVRTPAGQLGGTYVQRSGSKHTVNVSGIDRKVKNEDLAAEHHANLLPSSGSLVGGLYA